MKKVTSLIITFISVLSLTGCSCKGGLFSLMTTRKNSFFRDGELNKLHIKGLPTFEYENSYLEIKGKKLKGYFNVADNVLDNYAKEILDYYKSSDLTYGALIDNSYMFGIPNIFDMLKTKNVCKNVQHLKFYKLYNDRYAFFYEVDEQFYEVLIKRTTNTVDNKEYNFLFEASTVSNLQWSNRYEEIIIPDENLKDYFDIYVVPHEDGAEGVSIQIDFKQVMKILWQDFNIEISYIEFGQPGTYKLDEISNGYTIYFTERNSGRKYHQNDLILSDYYFYAESAYIKDKKMVLPTNYESSDPYISSSEPIISSNSGDEISSSESSSAAIH